MAPSEVDLGARHRSDSSKDFFEESEALAEAPAVVDEESGVSMADDLEPVAEDEEAAVEEELGAVEEEEEQAPPPPKKEKRRSTAGAWVGGLVLGGVVTAVVLLGLWLVKIEPPTEWRGFLPGGNATPVASNGPTTQNTAPPPLTAVNKADLVKSGDLDQAANAGVENANESNSAEVAPRSIPGAKILDGSGRQGAQCGRPGHEDGHGRPGQGGERPERGRAVLAGRGEGGGQRPGRRPNGLSEGAGRRQGQPRQAALPGRAGPRVGGVEAECRRCEPRGAGPRPGPARPGAHRPFHGASAAARSSGSRRGGGEVLGGGEAGSGRQVRRRRQGPRRGHRPPRKPALRRPGQGSEPRQRPDGGDLHPQLQGIGGVLGAAGETCRVPVCPS